MKYAIFERMKTKNFYIAIGFLVVTSASLWLLNNPSPTFQNIVTKTQKGIKNLPSNMQIQGGSELTVNPTYLSRLGLNKKHLPEETNDRSSDYVVASGAEPNKMEDAIVFMSSVDRFLPGHQLIMFDLGLSESEGILLNKYCNSSWNCHVRKMDFQKLPSHIADLSIKSYRPICIQDLLNTYSTVIWADSAEYFKSGNLTGPLEQAKVVGLVAWTIEDPTSAITHPKMFQFFKAEQKWYYFHRAVESSHLIVVYTPTVEEKIMLPWVKCALMEECINPTGAQDYGCNFLRKPLFLYSGCHHYDMSALNIILGQLFDFDERPYASKEVIFGNLNEDRIAAKNSSDPLLKSRLKVKEYLNGKADKV